MDARQRWLWTALLITTLIAGFVYSLVQPLGNAPDETAHMRYIRFLQQEHRLPEWKLEKGGEAGYEGQHPPLYYFAGSLIYAATSALPEPLRWQVLRWSSLALGLVLALVIRGLCLTYFRNKFSSAFTATAAFCATPLVLEYLSHINPDALSVLWSAIVLWMAIMIARGEDTPRDRVILGVALGLGLLTKLTILGTGPVILAAFAIRPTGYENSKSKFFALLETILIAVLIGGWWYVRNSWLYNTPFLHTAGRFGSGVDVVRGAGQFGHFLGFTLKATYLSAWQEIGWTPGLLGVLLYLLITMLLVIAVLVAVTKRLRYRSENFDSAPWLCGLFILTLIVSHQAQVWLVDFEFNAGGRYLLNGLIAVHLLVIGSFGGLKWTRTLQAVWVGVFVIFSIASVHNLATSVNPSAIPAWQPLHIYPNYPADME